MWTDREVFKMERTPVLAITLGDQAGSSPEIAVKVILNKTEDYMPVFIGNKAQLQSILPIVEGSEKLTILDWDGARKSKTAAMSTSTTSMWKRAASNAAPSPQRAASSFLKC